MHTINKLTFFCEFLVHKTKCQKNNTTYAIMYNMSYNVIQIYQKSNAKSEPCYGKLSKTNNIVGNIIYYIFLPYKTKIPSGAFGKIPSPQVCASRKNILVLMDCLLNKLGSGDLLSAVPVEPGDVSFAQNLTIQKLNFAVESSLFLNV